MGIGCFRVPMGILKLKKNTRTHTHGYFFHLGMGTLGISCTPLVVINKSNYGFTFNFVAWIIGSCLSFVELSKMFCCDESVNYRSLNFEQLWPTQIFMDVLCCLPCKSTIQRNKKIFYFWYSSVLSIYRRLYCVPYTK